jgi:WD40 repeat protein
LIHIFQRVDGYPDPYSLTTTLDDHTSTVTSVKFSEDKGVTKLISTSTDKSILFRKISIDSGEVSLSIYHREATGLPVYDIEIDPREMSFVGVGAETKISLWDITGGKKTKSIAVTDADSVKGISFIFSTSVN